MAHDIRFVTVFTQAFSAFQAEQHSQAGFKGLLFEAQNFDVSICFDVDHIGFTCENLGK